LTLSTLLVTPAQGVCDLQEVKKEPKNKAEMATSMIFLIDEQFL
jgi:hypothetical protein